ncbi:TM1266 family iron-only hydrogenase system putative regulator [Caproiciproducens faecalis]|uniref:Iron-only hydrogenase system regulator n=1 Tax=Caproiciproducens faecalis TaxID=2820301 RepID=A0ABS7DN62_9FIRM|nr:TM1266 family iron-only hydrogenase system putative regulator [Caproiciproducens faecalis]MBW7572240.1 iron-only hydrogenase system regulator [Caproiciproducens faecalis]
MESRIALVGIVVENTDSVERINSILHEYGEYIVGRMGIPYPKRHISVISIVMDAPGDVISALSGKLGMIPHVNIKTVYSKVSPTQENENGDCQ